MTVSTAAAESALPTHVPAYAALSLPAPFGEVEHIVGALAWLTLIIAVISLLVIAAKMVMASLRKNSVEASEAVSQIPWVLLAVCITFVAVPMVTVLIPGTGIGGNAEASDSILSVSDNTDTTRFSLAIASLIAWGKGIVAVLAVLGLLWSAGRMALGKFGGSDLVVDGVGGVTWVVFGICLMLLSSLIIAELAGQPTLEGGVVNASALSGPTLRSPSHDL